MKKEDYRLYEWDTYQGTPRLHQILRGEIPLTKRDMMELWSVFVTSGDMIGKENF